MNIVRTVTVEQPLSRVFEFLSDFTTTELWDPATVRTERVSGTGGVGTHYRNVSRFLGREAVLDYHVTELDPLARFALRGRNRTLAAHDEMSFTGDDRSATVRYAATFELRGLARLVGPFLRPAFRRLGDRAEEGLQRTLAGLGG